MELTTPHTTIHCHTVCSSLRLACIEFPSPVVRRCPPRLRHEHAAVLTSQKQGRPGYALKESYRSPCRGCLPLALTKHRHHGPQSGHSPRVVRGVIHTVSLP